MCSLLLYESKRLIIIVKNYGELYYLDDIQYVRIGQRPLNDIIVF